ncbi:MAG: fibrobacter succinogenes major paralogous domain-containing protein, partial [Flavobacteriaceae bacterium]|nr:fibrobacter succinogenes major paralogous domain-containing protein [Flavobacteriaceae bacterium]
TEFTKFFGDLYQWGRKTDGHEKVLSTTSSTKVLIDNFDNAGDKFVTTSSAPHDWLEGTNSKLGRWGSVDPDTPQSTINYKGVNDPCPDGFRVPSTNDWKSIINGVGDNNGITENDTGYHNGVNRWKWMNSPNAGWLIYPPKQEVTTPGPGGIDDYEDTPTLFLPRVMYRVYSGGNFSASGGGHYWSSTIYNNNYYSSVLRINHGGNYNADSNSGSRSYGYSVRCVAESRILAN